MTRYTLKCEVCNKTVGYVDDPKNPESAVKGYYCGSPSEAGSCAQKWQVQVQKENKKQEIEVLKEKLKQALKELKTAGEV